MAHPETTAAGASGSGDIGYCTILATNYLPKALALAESLRRHEDGAVLRVLFIDARSDDQLPDVPGVDCLSTASLGIPLREVLHLAMTYNLVEFATAVKPLLLKALLAQHEQVFYLDPDTYVTAPMVELGPALESSRGGILLTPHFLSPVPAEVMVTEGHVLLVGIYNLGFCGVDRRAGEFLEWWWDHLRDECLLDPLSGLFVDQKWMDVGSTLFHAASFEHAGYNVGVLNLHERPVELDADGYVIASTGDRLRLFHFHAYDTREPEKLSVRFKSARENPLDTGSAIFQLSKEYAAAVSNYEATLPPAPGYPYAQDATGRPISKQLRRAYRLDAQAEGMLPSPFLEEDARAYAKWRRKAWRTEARGLLGDAAKCFRIVLPEEYVRVKKRFPKLAGRLSDEFSGGAGMWGNKA